MALKASDKAKRAGARAAKPGEAAAASEPRGTPAADRIAELEAERDRLKAELAAARERISRLEEARAQVVNRIDWVIDSLHTLIEDES
jgi:chromosome segregation ATPase